MTEVQESTSASPPRDSPQEKDSLPVETTTEANGTTEDVELPPADPTEPEKASSPLPSTSKIDVDPPAAAPEPEQDAAEKKRIQDQLRQESRKRGNRMFGMMLGTLKRAKQQVDTSVESDSMKKRLELEKKLKDKLDGEKKVLQIRSEREREVRDLRMNIQKKEEEISSADAIYRVRHDAKYNLAGFLCTSFPLPTPASVTDAVSVPFSPRLPHSMHLTNPAPASSRPIYYLPYRLLPSQEDRIEDQIELVKKATKRDQEEWRDLKAGKQKEIRKLRDELEDKLEDVGRIEREDRQRKRREAEEREESERREREKRRKVEGRERSEPREKDMKMDDVEGENGTTKDEIPATTMEDVKEDVAENDKKVDGEAAEDGKEENGDDERQGSEQPKEAAVKENDKMDLAGEEDLEY